MPFKLITKPASHTIFRHLIRKIMQLIGVLLVIVGLGASSLPVLFIVIAVVSIVSPSADFPNLDADQAATFIIATVVALVGLILGLKLIRGKRRLVLLLRRFGFSEATKTLSYAAASAMGQRWRLVTLDDNEIAPVLGLKTQGRVFNILRWVIFIAIAAGLFWLLGDGFTDYLKNLTEDTGGSSNDGGFKEKIGAIIGQFILMIIVAAFIGGLVILFLGFLSAGLLFTWRSHRSYKKAVSTQSKEISRPDDVQSVIREVFEQSKKIFAPRLSVIRVKSDYWQQVVKGFADISSVIIVDVSSPGEGLLWELKTLKGNIYKHVLLVGHYSSLERLMLEYEGQGITNDMDGKLIEMLRGETVLAYLNDTPRQMKRFSKLLRSRLNDLY